MGVIFMTPDSSVEASIDSGKRRLLLSVIVVPGDGSPWRLVRGERPGGVVPRQNWWRRPKTSAFSFWPAAPGIRPLALLYSAKPPAALLFACA